MEPWRFVRQAPMLLTDVAALTVVAGIACTVMLLGHLLVARGEAAIRAKPVAARRSISERDPFPRRNAQPLGQKPISYEWSI